ncbi:MAG TPA: hypothetical protein VKY39_02050 [Aggregatilineales bacterium]|nr:hypothetical protein [Aggregatilineales bacterium]
MPPAQKFCLCIPPFYLTTGVGTIWQCDSCGRVYERVAGSPAWTRIEHPDRENGSHDFEEVIVSPYVVRCAVCGKPRYPHHAPDRENGSER